MGDHRAATGSSLVEPREDAGNVFVGEPVKAVASGARLGQRTRQAVKLRDLRNRSMKGGVEAGDLRHVRAQLRERLDGLQIAGLMHGREGYERTEPIKEGSI